MSLPPIAHLGIGRLIRFAWVGVPLKPLHPHIFEEQAFTEMVSRRQRFNCTSTQRIIVQTTMRDLRFMAEHRGGPLDMNRHRSLARWAADCAEHVIHHFTCVSDDTRPLHAIELAREWAKGNVSTGACMKASVTAHAAARAVQDPAAVAAARAAGHAVATAHFAEHALGSIVYGHKAMIAAGESAARELAWQKKKLPAAVRELVLSALQQPKYCRRC